MPLLDRLLSNLYRSFDKDPVERIALRVRHPAGLAWRVQGRALAAATVAGDPLGTVDLTRVNFNGLADALEALGCRVIYRDLDLAGRAADTLLDGVGREDQSNGDALTCYTSPLWALLDSFALALNEASASVDSALVQSRMHTADGEWLDYWGSHYGVYRGLQVLLGGDLGEVETNELYLLRIVREVLRPRVNKIAIEDAILELAGEQVELFEPWRQIFILDQSQLSGVDRLHDGVYWTWNIIQPIIYGTTTSKNWERVLKIIERNRPLGNLVAAPVWVPDAVEVDVRLTDAVEFVHEYTLEMETGIQYERPLGVMALDDNTFTFNEPVLGERVLGLEPLSTIYGESPGWYGNWDSRTWFGQGSHVIGGQAPDFAGPGDATDPPSGGAQQPPEEVETIGGADDGAGDGNAGQPDDVDPVDVGGGDTGAGTPDEGGGQPGDDVGVGGDQPLGGDPGDNPGDDEPGDEPDGDTGDQPPPEPEPEPYTPLSYVTFDGQTAVDLGIDQLGLPIISCDYQHTAFTNAQFYMLLGVRASPGNGDSFLIVCNATSNRTIFQYGAVMKASTIGTMTLSTNRRTLQINGKKVTLTDGSTASVTATSDEPAVAGNLWLGAGSDQGTPIAGSMFVGNIFGLTVAKAGEVVLDLIPARVGATVGLWDRVSQTLLTPSVGVLTGAS